MAVVIDLAQARREREAPAAPVEGPPDALAPALTRRRIKGDAVESLPPITFSPDGPVGSINRTRWKRMSRGWAGAVECVEDPLRFAGSDETAETHEKRRADAVRRMELAAADLFWAPSPTREDFRNKIRLLAAAIGCREPGTIPHAHSTNRWRRYGDSPANAPSLVEKMLSGLYEWEVPAPYTLRRGVKREGEPG